jgi:hypothetical protein
VTISFHLSSALTSALIGVASSCITVVAWGEYEARPGIRIMLRRILWGVQG